MALKASVGEQLGVSPHYFHLLACSCRGSRADELRQKIAKIGELIRLKAIERWVAVNAIDSNSNLVELVKNASGKLFFLANKSQEQIPEDYRTSSREVAELTDAIAMKLS